MFTHFLLVYTADRELLLTATSILRGQWSNYG